MRLIEAGCPGVAFDDGFEFGVRRDVFDVNESVRSTPFNQINDSFEVATVPGAKASFYEGIGHSPFWEDPARFNRELIEFMNIIK